MIEATPRPPVALYVHVPFCLSVCPYCDFVVYGGRLARRESTAIQRFLRAVAVEIGVRADAADVAFRPARPPLRSVYLGGGTPSLLAADEVAALLALVDWRFGVAGDAEITLEANPAPGDRGDLAGFRAAGVNRISFGAQSFHAAELRALGRRHRAEDVAAAVEGARAAGYDNISLDLLYDVPGQTRRSWAATLAAALSLQPEHISAYALDLADPASEGRAGDRGDHLPPRPGARRWRAAARAGQDEDRAAAMYELAESVLADAGFVRYELSNWARPARESRHNRTYWSGEAWEAVGPGAHRYDGALTRCWNAAPLEPYLAALLAADPSLPPSDLETMDPARLPGERAILGLRLESGISAALAGEPSVAPAVAWSRQHGLVESTPHGDVRLTARGRLLSNEVFVRLLSNEVFVRLT